MSEQETTRRETLKLAAAVAAFGTALGYRQAEGAGRTEIKTEKKVQLKIDRLEFKFYADDKLVHTCAVPAVQLKHIKRASKFDYKIYRDGQPWDPKAS
jgi:hypothetical protein